ncbi:hypothetical protein D6829_02285, partial [Candidatus Pacearchaeota archaeon]
KNFENFFGLFLNLFCPDKKIEIPSLSHIGRKLCLKVSEYILVNKWANSCFTRAKYLSLE